MPEEVPRHPYDSHAAAELLRAKRPVVLTGSGLVESSVSRWTLEYLREHVGDDATFDVYASKGHFLYSDEAKNSAGYDFQSHVRKYTSTFGDFVDEVNRRSEADSNSSELDHDSDSTTIFSCASNNESQPAEKIYLQHMLYEGLGEAIVRDFQQWKWGWALKWQTEFGPLSTNMLLVGQRGVVTPTHYDEQQNFFAQIAGRKVVTLYSPADFHCLYPYPVGHPADRQSQVRAEAPDLARFPLFAGASASSTTLAPGEVLYIPSYWWHHIASPFEHTVSTNFWFRPRSAAEKQGGGKAPELPLRCPTERMALRRNIEKIAAQALGPAASRALFAAVERGEPLGAEQEKTRTQLQQLIGMVIAKEEVEGFLAELVRGRFAAQDGACEYGT